MSINGVYSNPKRIQVLNELKPSIYQKGVQSFFGKINFVQRFIPIYALIDKPINKLLRKNQAFEWNAKSQREFANIKLAIASFPVLVCPNFDNHFIIYSFSSKDTIVANLLRRIKGEKIC